MLLYFFFLRFSSLATIYSIIGTQDRCAYVGGHFVWTCSRQCELSSEGPLLMDVLFVFHRLLYVCTDKCGWWIILMMNMIVVISNNVQRAPYYHACSLVLSLIVVAANYVKFTCNLYILFVNDANILCCRLCWCYCWPSCSWHGLLASLALA